MVYADRLMRLLAEEALCRLPSITEDGEVQTPVGTAREDREEITTKRDRHSTQLHVGIEQVARCPNSNMCQPTL